MHFLTTELLELPLSTWLNY